MKRKDVSVIDMDCNVKKTKKVTEKLVQNKPAKETETKFELECINTKVDMIFELLNDGKDPYQLGLNYLKRLSYTTYLESEHWKHFKQAAIKAAQYKCQLCSKDKTFLFVHHKTYENRGRETFNDIIVLCQSCHKLVHGIEVE